MWRKTIFLAGMAALIFAALSAMAAVPRQGERPPQSLFEDFFSGSISLQGSPAPAGSQLVACIIDYTTGFESQPVTIGPEGRYERLELNPSEEALIGRIVSFYLVNQYGRIKAVETTSFVGVFDFYFLDLTFNQPLPVPTPRPTATSLPTLTPTASLPAPGDRSITAIPRLALIIGTATVVGGAGLIVLARRRLD